MIKNYLSHFLPVLLALDLIIPFLLAPFYKDYNHLTQVMSVLGNSKAPLHSIYNIWLVAFGVAILISTLQLYPTVAQVSSSISIMLFSVIVIYAVGGCIFSGIFSVGETKSLETLSAKIHGYGSVIGFLLLTLAPLFVGLYFFKVSNGLLGILSLICFIMIDAGYNYDRLAEKMGWLGIDPQSIRHILITHQDTDHVGAVEADSPGLFRSAKLYIGEIENRYLTGEVRRKVIYHLYKLPQVTINNEKVLLHDGETFEIDGIKIECFLVPGHTWGHMVYLIDDKYLFTGDTIWFGADGGYSFISSLAESNKLAVKSLAALEQKLQSRGLRPLFLTGHTGWTDNFEFAFAHKDKLCSPFKKRVPDPTAPYDAYDESDDTEKMAKSGFLKGVGR